MVISAFWRATEPDGFFGKFGAGGHFETARTTTSKQLHVRKIHIETKRGETQWKWNR